MDIEVDIKVQKRREKIGLVVFVFAILAIFAAVIMYMTFSRGLDVAASNIDSNVNQLNGYSTVIFEGTNAPRQKKDSSNKILALGANLFNLEENQSDDSSIDDKNLEKATQQNISTFYYDKGSTVCGIKCGDYAAYTNGEIFQKDNWNIGVLSITQEYLDQALIAKVNQIHIENPKQDTSKKNNDANYRESSQSVKTKTAHMIELQKKIDLLRYENKADFVILIAPDQSALDLIDKVDCAIFSKVSDDVGDSGNFNGSTFIMRNPDLGCVGAILASPAKMLSARTYSQVEIKED